MLVTVASDAPLVALYTLTRALVSETPGLVPPDVTTVPEMVKLGVRTSGMSIDVLPLIVTTVADACVAPPNHWVRLDPKHRSMLVIRNGLGTRRA